MIFIAFHLQEYRKLKINFFYINAEIAKFWIDNGNMETFEDAFAQRSLLLQNNFLSLELILWNFWMFFLSVKEVMWDFWRENALTSQ